MNYIFIFFIGSVFGSFFYTLSVRYIDGSFNKNIFNALFSSSRCQVCGQRINPLYLIPVIGFFLTKTKCDKCGAKIPVIYLLMEIFYGSVALILSLKFGYNLYSASVFMILGISVLISVIDIKIQVIPNVLVLFFIVSILYPVILNNSLKDTLYGLIFMAVFFVIVLLVFPGSFGGGDLKFAASIGLLLGLEMSIVALEAALITGSLAGIIYAIIKRKGLRIKMPFAPFLTAGMFVSLFYGRDILLVYYNLVF